MFGSPLVPARIRCSSSSACTSFAGRDVRRPVRKPAPWWPDHRADDAGLADVLRDALHALEQLLRLDRLDDGFDRRAGHGPAAVGRAERVELHGRRHLRRHQQRRARGNRYRAPSRWSPCPARCRRDSRRRDGPCGPCRTGPRRRSAPRRLRRSACAALRGTARRDRRHPPGPAPARRSPPPSSR